MQRSTRTIRYDFRGHHAIAAVAVGLPFVSAVTAASGSPTISGLAGGGIALALDSTNEAQNVCLYMGDVLAFDIDDIIGGSIIAKTGGLLSGATSMAWGLATARNNDPDALAAGALFRCIGGNNVVVESDDGITDIDDVSTGITLGSRWKKFALDFAERVTTMEPPNMSLGRKSHVAFFAANDLDSNRRVASDRRFDMSGYSGGLQFFFQIQKTAAAAANALHILEAEIEVNLPW